MALVERWRPDVIVHETAEASAPIAGHVQGVPSARVSVPLATCSEAWWLSVAAPAFDGLLVRLGVGPNAGAERLHRTPLLTRAPGVVDVEEGDPPFDVRRFRHEDDRDAMENPELLAVMFARKDAPSATDDLSAANETGGHRPRQ